MEHKKHKTIAIAYDFDGTLGEGNMQEYGLLQHLGYSVDDFWSLAKKMTIECDGSPTITYLNLIIQCARKRKIKITKNLLAEYAKKIILFKGVDTWFERVNKYAKKNNVLVEHFIISSGLREMIGSLEIAKYFTKIYGSGFIYNQKGFAYAPAIAIDFTGKMQFLYRINKNILDVYDNSLNKKHSHDDRKIPFSQMIYIGDGETDVAAMTTVKKQGGTSISVYNNTSIGSKIIADELHTQGRANASILADYSKNSVMENMVFDIIGNCREAM